MATLRERVDLLNQEITKGGGTREQRADWAAEIISLTRSHYGEESNIVKDARRNAELFSHGIDEVWDSLRGTARALARDVEATPAASLSPGKMGTEVFVVHGHDEGAKEMVSRFIEKLGLKAVVLHEQANAGRTIIEKFEDCANVGFAVVLLTADDEGRASGSELPANARARQNVIFELGYFTGKLGRGRICALHKGGVEIPTDYLGVLYVALDERGFWRLQLAKELKEAGLPVDLNLAL